MAYGVKVLMASDLVGLQQLQSLLQLAAFLQNHGFVHHHLTLLVLLTVRHLLLGLLKGVQDLNCQCMVPIEMMRNGKAEPIALNIGLELQYLLSSVHKAWNVPRLDLHITCMPTLQHSGF